MSLASELKDALQHTKKEDLDENTKSNFSSALNKLSSTLLAKVNANEIEVTDVKDIKDLSSIFVAMQQTFSDNSVGTTPPVDKKVASFFGDKLNAKKESPLDKDEEAIVDLDKLENLSDSDINELVEGQGKIENENNVEKASEA